MTQQEKELLFKDLSGRLPYEVKIYYHYSNGERVVDEDRKLTFDDLESMKYDIDNPQDYWCEISWKPYLRPMSNMTEEEKAYYFAINEDIVTVTDWLNKKHFDFRGLIEKGLALEAPKDMYKF